MTMRHLYKYILVGVACLLIGAAGTALAMHTGGGEVRLVAQRHEDGRVEIGLQEREVGGGWGERQLPDARFLSAGAMAGQWRASSPLDIGAGRYHDGALACIIGHGRDDDIFWSMVGQGVETASEDLKMNLRFSIAPTPDQQAALVRECVSDDAHLIATTLAAPEALAPAIAEALAAGVQVATFNSGTESAPASGSAMHIGLDDQLGGKTRWRSLQRERRQRYRPLRHPRGRERWPGGALRLPGVVVSGRSGATTDWRRGRVERCWSAGGDCRATRRGRCGGRPDPGQRHA